MSGDYADIGGIIEGLYLNRERTGQSKARTIDRKPRVPVFVVGAVSKPPFANVMTRG